MHDGSAAHACLFLLPLPPTRACFCCLYCPLPQAGKITEEEAQELIDQFVMKLRIVRQLRTPEYDQLFAGDPTWVSCRS